MRRSRRWIASNIVTATLCVCVRACVCACVFKDIQFLWEHFSTTKCTTCGPAPEIWINDLQFVAHHQTWVLSSEQKRSQT